MPCEKRGNLVVLKSPIDKAAGARPFIRQRDLEDLVRQRRELREKKKEVIRMEELIAAALCCGLEVEPGIRSAELVPIARSSSRATIGTYMKLVILLLIIAMFPCHCAAQAAPKSEPMKTPAAQTKFEKHKKKLLAKQEKAEAEQRAWEFDTRPPDPAYPASLRPEYIIALRQAAALIDNAFDYILKTRFEFTIANQSAQQAAALVRASAQNQGELQAAEALAAYARSVPACQEIAWNTMAVLFGNYQQCQREAARLRVIADRTVQRNSQPISAPHGAPEAPLPLPPAEMEKFPPDKSLGFSLVEGQSSLAVRFRTLRYETVSVNADGTGPSVNIYPAGDGASFLVSKSIRIMVLDLANLQIFVGDSLVGSLTGSTVEIVVQK